MGSRQSLLICCCLAAMTGSANATLIQYEVKAKFLGREAQDLPSQLTSSQKEEVAKNMQLGLVGATKAEVYSSDSYSVMPSILADWTKMKVSLRRNGWDDKVYLSAQGGLSTLGGRRTLARYVPHGQMLLLAGKTTPALAFEDLKGRGVSNPSHLAAINDEGSRAISWQGDHLTEQILYKGGSRKYAEYRMVQGTSLEIRRFHPKGSLLSIETWKPLGRLPESARPAPTWESLQIGSWVMDERDTSQPMHKRWQGYGKEPASADAQPVTATTFKLGWMAPGVMMLFGGVGLLVYQTVRRRPARKEGKAEG